MRRQADRYSLDLPVELFIDGKKQSVALHDLSRSGMFLRVAPLVAGTRVHVAMAPEGRRVVTTARVTHSLAEADALALGRSPGVGIAFREPVDPADHLFAITVERLIRDRRALAPAAGFHIVVGDPQIRILERMSTALAEVGFSVDTATTGMETLAACLRRIPDVVVVDRSMPIVDGFHVLETILRDEHLSGVPVIVTSVDPGDLAAAFERGAMDFIAKPFTAVEVIARASRLVTTMPRTTDRAMLRGTIADLGLPALLTMLEQERKTGRLELTGAHSAWIDIVDGRIVGVESAVPSRDAQTTLMALLDWTQGTFELSAIAGPQNDSNLAMPVTHALLEHARLQDETSRLIRLDPAFRLRSLLTSDIAFS